MLTRIFCSALLLFPLGLLAQSGKVSVWLTNPDKSALFALQSSPLRFSKPGESLPTISIDEQQRFQSIDGFGFALTGGSAQLLTRMSSQSRDATLKELFAENGKNIGISCLRVSIGASDMNDRVFSYDDLPAGQTDLSLAHFTLAHDEADVIPVLKQVLAINPKIRILGSPWSAPTWMKTNGDVKGGHLKEEYYPVYAQYFVRYIQGMKAHGITIAAITIQNEPLNPKNTPSMLMEAPEEAAFIKKSLGPAFKKANLSTKILVYDHNCDVPEYPLSILRDPDASQYVDGSAFHLYGGKIEAMSQVHDAFPNKNLYFTEFMAEDLEHPNRMELAPHVHGTVIGAVRN
jgi:glucosylceramidase